MHFSMGRSEKRKKVYKIILVLLYYLNTMTVYDIYSAEREKEKIKSECYTVLPTGAKNIIYFNLLYI